MTRTVYIPAPARLVRRVQRLRQGAALAVLVGALVLCAVCGGAVSEENVMATEWICDGCGKRLPGVPGRGGQWHKPRAWYERSDEDGIQTCCSRECIDKVAAASGKTSVVLPI